jgi:hypothetical protein
MKLRSGKTTYSTGTQSKKTNVKADTKTPTKETMTIDKCLFIDYIRKMLLAVEVVGKDRHIKAIMSSHLFDYVVHFIDVIDSKDFSDDSGKRLLLTVYDKAQELEKSAIHMKKDTLPGSTQDICLEHLLNSLSKTKEVVKTRI